MTRIIITRRDSPAPDDRVPLGLKILHRHKTQLIALAERTGRRQTELLDLALEHFFRNAEVHEEQQRPDGKL